MRTSANESEMYSSVTKAGEYIDSEGQVRLAGVDEDSPDENFRI